MAASSSGSRAASAGAAAAAARAGARVTLISGPVALAPPRGVELREVLTAADMYAATHEVIGDADIFVAAAAVADYRPAEVAAAKIKKAAERMTLELVRTQDILASVAALLRRVIPRAALGGAQELLATGEEGLPGSAAQATQELFLFEMAGDVSPVDAYADPERRHARITTTALDWGTTFCAMCSVPGY